MGRDVDSAFELVAAIVERAHYDKERKYGPARSLCVATTYSHPAEECAGEFLDWIDTLTVDDVTPEEICHEVLQHGLRRGTSYSLFESEAS